jgi:hypothetical protein
MQRRKFFQSAAVSAGAAASVEAQQPPAAPAPTELPKLDAALADDVGVTTTGFFTPPQFAALRRLAEILMPPLNGAPGALDAGAPEFLDFLIGASPAAQKKVYTDGLDALNAAARKAHGKPFAELADTQAESVLAPLRLPWTYDPPSDPLERFLKEAKADIRTATMNSRQNAAAASSRRFGGGGLYWLPID